MVDQGARVHGCTGARVHGCWCKRALVPVRQCGALAPPEATGRLRLPVAGSGPGFGSAWPSRPSHADLTETSALKAPEAAGTPGTSEHPGASTAHLRTRAPWHRYPRTGHPRTLAPKR